MTSTCRAASPWFLWPVAALLDLLGMVVVLSGRAMLVVLGLGLLVGGTVATATLVGAPLGVPLFLVGLLLVVRGLF